MFRIVEDAILITIAILTVAAVIFELIVVFDNQTVGLADLLLMFIYAEVFGMVAVYFKSHEIPVIYPLFIAITALARLIVLQGKDSQPEQLIFEAAASKINCSGCESLPCRTINLASAVIAINRG